MEHNDYFETSDHSSDSENSLSANELTKDTKLKEIDRLKRKIAELEHSTAIKEAKKTKKNHPYKARKSSDQTIIIEDEPTINKMKKSPNQSQPPLEEDDTEFSSDEPEQVVDFFI